ncbi:uncharacterized protein LOC134797267 [Cydia splendana]|uniref:uncharacterized protein LOC134797267 n=1 Tax=Cydia splendana TaxID=1100963 RepID=UPI00211FEA4F
MVWSKRWPLLLRHITHELLPTKTKLSDMRSFLLLAFILYDIVAQAASNYDYEDLEGKHVLNDDRRNWRKKALDQGSDVENLIRGQRRYDGGGKSAEQYEEKEQKTPAAMNCDRPRERYEPCFSGCASVSCDNPRDRLRPCYPFCEPGCVCVPPYVRDDRTHKCVLQEECTKGLKGVPDIGEES